MTTSSGSGRTGATERRRALLLAKLASAAPQWGAITHQGTVAFGPGLVVQRFRLANGLEVLLCEDHSAPVVAFHTWYHVGSRHERPGKTGLAHLFEHLMFNETRRRPAGEFDKLLEAVGAENNASTWLDWTQYTINVPKESLPLVISLEAERMSELALSDKLVASEKEVVANERRYRVEDDVEGALSELLWATAFQRHSYRWPTIGWMDDILAFTTGDCEAFYKTYYAPNNATLVVVGDVTEAWLLPRISSHYGALPPAELPTEDVWPELPQLEGRRLEVTKPTATDKLLIGYKAPALGDADHPYLGLLAEVLLGGRASRLHSRLVRDLEWAAEARIFLGPFRDRGLLEVFVSARGEHRAEDLLGEIDAQIDSLRQQPVTSEELARALARFELGMLSGLTTLEGKATTIGFYDTVVGNPGLALERMAQLRRCTPGDLLRVARTYLEPGARTVVIARPERAAAPSAEEAPAGTSAPLRRIPPRPPFAPLPGFQGPDAIWNLGPATSEADS